MKKYTIDEILKMDNCDNIKCIQCPFWLKEYDEKYKIQCNALIYCEKNNIYYNNKIKIASEIYIQHLKNKK